MLCLNAQGLMNGKTRWKIDALKEYVSTNNIILMNFTETWLKKKMQDEKSQTTQPSDVIGRAKNQKVEEQLSI